MKAGGTNLLLLTISAFWSSSRWPLATSMSSRRQISIPLGGRYNKGKTVFILRRGPDCTRMQFHLYIRSYVDDESAYLSE